MATVLWRGGAAAVAQVQTFTFGGTWEATDVIRVVIGTKTVDITAGSTTTNTVVDNVVTAWNALTSAQHPEFAEITASRSSSNLVLTADTAGKTLVCTITPLEAGGGAADDQTIEGAGTATTGTTATANAGPNDWTTAANWSTAAVPVAADDVVIENSAISILYGLAAAGATLTSLTIKQSYTGTIGLPERNAGGYAEYRTRYLTIDATSVKVGQGDGNGSGRIKINAGTVQTDLNVYDSGTATETGIPALLWKGTHVANTVTINRGDVGVAYFGGETAVIATLKVGYVTNQGSDATVVCGSGVTLTTITKTGGNLQVNSNITTITQEGGTLTVASAATVTTLNLNTGTCYYESSGTCTTANVVGTLDFRRDSRGRTMTQLNVYSGAAVYDPAASVTLTNGIDLIRCGLTDVTLDFGSHRCWTPSAI